MVEIIWCQRQAAPRSCRDDDILVCLIETGTSSIRDCNSISQIFRSNAVQCILQEPKEDTKPLRKRHSSGRGSSHCPATSCAPTPEPHLRPHPSESAAQSVSTPDREYEESLASLLFFFPIFRNRRAGFLILERPVEQGIHWKDRAVHLGARFRLARCCLRKTS